MLMMQVEMQLSSKMLQNGGLFLTEMKIHQLHEKLFKYLDELFLLVINLSSFTFQHLFLVKYISIKYIFYSSAIIHEVSFVFFLIILLMIQHKMQTTSKTLQRNNSRMQYNSWISFLGLFANHEIIWNVPLNLVQVHVSLVLKHKC